MAKREELRVDLTANDQASGKIDDVASKLEGLSGSAEVEITATDEATEKIDEVTEEVEGLDGEAAEVELAAEDEATEVVEEVAEAVSDLDGETAEPLLEADDQATDAIDGVSGDLAALDGESADTTIDLDDGGAAGDIEDVESALSDLDGTTATAVVETEGAADAAESTGGIVSNLQEIVGTGGLAALSAAGLLAVGSAAADSVLDIQGLANATGGTLEEASRLKEVWELAGGNTDTLERNVIRVNDRLRESPDLASALGIQIDENMSPMQLFIAAVSALNSGQLTANQRLDLAMELFGSKGVLMLNDLQTRVGDLGEGMAAVGEEEIITQDDVDAALEFQNKWDDVEDTIGDIARNALPAIAGAVGAIAALLDTWPVKQLLVLTEELGVGLGRLLNLEFNNTGFDELFGAMDAAREAGVDWADVLALVEDEGLTVAEAMAELGVTTEGTTAISEEATAALEDHVAALETERAALEQNIEALEDYVDAQRDSYDTEVDLREAKEKSTAAVDDYTEANQAYIDSLNAAEPVIADQEAAERARNDAGQDVISTVLDEADAYRDMRQAAIEADGGIYTATQGVDDFNTSLADTANMIPDELIPQFVDMAMEINDIPTEHRTAVEAAIGSGDPQRIEDTLRFLSRTREAAVKAESDKAALAQVERELESLRNKTRTAYIGVSGPGSGQSGGRYGRRARGDPFTSEGSLLVGEDGPELVDMPAGARVTNAGQTAELMRNSGGGSTNNYYNTYNYPAGVRSRDTVRAERRYARLQAS